MFAMIVVVNMLVIVYNNNTNSNWKEKNVHHFFKSFCEKILLEYGLLREIALWDSIASTNALWIGP